MTKKKKFRKIVTYKAEEDIGPGQTVIMLGVPLFVSATIVIIQNNNTFFPIGYIIMSSFISLLVCTFMDRKVYYEEIK